MAATDAVTHERRARTYQRLAIFVGLGLFVAFLVGVLGARGPGILTPESAFLVAGLAILVLAAALVYVLVTFRESANRILAQQATLRALEADVRKASAQTQAATSDILQDRSRLVSLERRITNDSESSRFLPRLMTIEQARLEDRATLADITAQMADLKEELVANPQQREWNARLHEILERLDSLELMVAHNQAENDNSMEWLSDEWKGHVKRDQQTSDALDALHEALERLTENVASLETRVSKAEAEEDTQDYRFDALDQRLAVMELEVSQAPRLTRSLEARVVEVEKALRSQRIAGEQVPTSFDESRLQTLEDKLMEHTVTLGEGDRRLAHIEALVVASADEVSRLDAAFREHEKHPAMLTVTDLRLAGGANGDDDLALIEGIGGVFRARLREQGVNSFDQLRAADPEQMAPLIGTRPKTLRAWQAMSELMRLPGIDHQVAELLVRIGIRSREELAQSSARNIVERVTEYNESHEIALNPRSVDEALARKWVQAAQPQLVTPTS